MNDLASLMGLTRSLAVYYGRPWRADRLAAFYGAFVEPGDLAFDIGAHVGNRSRAMARAGARVIALEPQDIFYRFLKRTMPPAVTVLPLAAGAAAAEGVMAVSRLHPTVSTIAPGFAGAVGNTPGFGTVRWDRSQPVAVTTLDLLIARYGRPALVKLDVEGHEADVLAGLSAVVPAVSFEFLPALPGVARACVDRLAALGDYEFNAIRGERNAFVHARWMEPAEMRRWLSDSAGAGRSGDIYARLRT